MGYFLRFFTDNLRVASMKIMTFMVYMIFSNSTSTLESVKTQDLKTFSNVFSFQHLPHLDRHAKLGSLTVCLLLSLLSPDLHVSLQ